VIHAAVAAVVVRAEIVSGTPQTTHAYVVNGEARYGAEFAPLVVRIVGGKAGTVRHVRFACVGKGCAFYTDSPKDGDRIDEGTYKVKADEHGTATLRVTMLNQGPAGSYRVYAEPVVAKGERAVRSAQFVLTSN
jgi:hypothetical protein